MNFTQLRAFDMVGNLRGRFDAVYALYLDGLRGHLKRRSVLSVLGQSGAAIVLGLTLLALASMVSGGGLTIATAGAALVAVRMLAAAGGGAAGSLRWVTASVSRFPGALNWRRGTCPY